MKIIQSLAEMQNASHDYRLAEKRIGFVPTMGALHEGHASLLKIARQQSDVTVASIFVNPTQFGPNEDLDKYPRPFEHDCEMAEQHGCDLLFAPHKEDMYPEGAMTSVVVDTITAVLEGASRQGHFKGVTTIVLKLCNIVMPHIVVFGQKDAQQAIVVKRMFIDLNMPLEMVVAPTIREKDGLALSSRNVYLTPEERKEVRLLYQGLCTAEQAHTQGEIITQALVQCIKDVYNQTNMFVPEYIAIVDAFTLMPIDTITGKTLIAVACRTSQSHTRLIDNIILGGQL